MPRKFGLEDIDRAANEKSHWRVQRVRKIAVVVTAAAIIAALAGLLGSGPISTTYGRNPANSLAVEYPRFLRMDAPFVMTVDAEAPPSGESLEVSFDVDYLRSFEVETISPDPANSRIGHGLTTYVFESQGGRSMIRFGMRPHTFGSVSGRMQTRDGEGIALRHFIYP
jgi:hypothetical protein